MISFVLLLTVSFGSYGLTDSGELKNGDAVFFNNFFKDNNNLKEDSLFSSKDDVLSLETPDFKLAQNSFVYGIPPHRILNTQTLGSIFGESIENEKDVIDYIVEPGDTLESIAQNFNISLDTLLWANELSKGVKLKVGQTLVVLPVSGVTYVVKSGDTLSEIGKVYKSKTSDIVAFNDLSNEGDIFIGDILILPNGLMPKKAPPVPSQPPIASNFFILPTEGKITQGLHWYNAIDVANQCGTPIHAATAGTVQRVKYGWNFGGGNTVTVLHSNGLVSSYGHLMTILVSPGQQVDIGDRIALMGGRPGMAGAGKSTGCHLHFGIVGGKNPLLKYPLGSNISYK